MTPTIYYSALALLGADAQHSLNSPPPPVDLTARMANLPACTPLSRTSRSPGSRPGLVADVQQAGEEAVLDGIDRITAKFPQTKCEARLK